MAKSSKSKTEKTKVDKTADDAVEIAETAMDAADATVDDILPETPEDNAAEPLQLDAADSVGELPDTSAPEVTDAALDDSDLFDDTPEPSEAEQFASDRSGDTPMTQPAPESQKSSGFMPLLLGGVIAGGIGYGIATYFPMMSSGTDDLTAQLSAQADQIAALEAQLADMPVTDLSGVEQQIATVTETTTGQINALAETVTGQFADVDARLLEVEKRPGADGTLSDTALAAYQRELEELRADLDAQQQSVMAAATQAEADLAAARAEAERLEQEALAAAEAAVVRAAINRVAAAVETGAPFADALTDLQNADLPPALIAAAENGVATNAQLTSEFPAVARSALATARSEGVSDDAGGLGGFLRSQFDVRSTAPKEGSGPDAVLSRAEASVKEGRIADALAELEALPEVARAELTDWTARATQRADVLDAIATLSETYN